MHQCLKASWLGSVHSELRQKMGWTRVPWAPQIEFQRTVTTFDLTPGKVHAFTVSKFQLLIRQRLPLPFKHFAHGGCLQPSFTPYIKYACHICSVYAVHAVTLIPSADLESLTSVIELVLTKAAKDGTKQFNLNWLRQQST